MTGSCSSLCVANSNASLPASLWETLLLCLSYISAIILLPPHHSVALGTIWDSYGTICQDIAYRFSITPIHAGHRNLESYSPQISYGKGAESSALESLNKARHFIIPPSDLKQRAQIRMGVGSDSGPLLRGTLVSWLFFQISLFFLIRQIFLSIDSTGSFVLTCQDMF